MTSQSQRVELIEEDEKKEVIEEKPVEEGSEFRVYSGGELIESKFQKREWLVEQMMRERDTVIVCADPKVGKSLLMFQLAMCLTSGEPFLSDFNVKRQCNVCYIAMEGELSDWQDRLVRMAKTIHFVPERFSFYFSKPQRMQDKVSELVKDIILSYNEKEEPFNKPDVVIIDPLYMASIGASLSDDKEMRKFLGNVRIMKDFFKCSVVMVHHTHKLKHTITGGEIEETGNNKIFGSQMFFAFTDQLFYFYDNKRSGYKELCCSGQRSGSVIKDIVLKLVQPEPLYFERVFDYEKSVGTNQAIINAVKDAEIPMTVDDVCFKSGVKRATFFRHIKQLLSEGKVKRIQEGRDVFYTTV